MESNACGSFDLVLTQIDDGIMLLKCQRSTCMDISSLTFACTQLQIQHQLEETSFVPNWNEILKVGWERNLLIKKPTPKEMALTILVFPNVPFNWEFLNLWEMIINLL
jgi:hypothetical protein